jgi:hypothetical protein
LPPGVYDLAKKPPDVLAAEAAAKAIPATEVIAAAGTAVIGSVVSAAAAGAATARVRLVPAIRWHAGGTGRTRDARRARPEKRVSA